MPLDKSATPLLTGATAVITELYSLSCAGWDRLKSKSFNSRPHTPRTVPFEEQTGATTMTTPSQVPGSCERLVHRQLSETLPVEPRSIVSYPGIRELSNSSLHRLWSSRLFSRAIWGVPRNRTIS